MLKSKFFQGVMAAILLVFVLGQTAQALTMQEILQGYDNLKFAGGGQVLGASTAPSNGLVGYWALDDASGSSAVDSSGNGNTGSLSGAAWAAGKDNGGLQFNGSNADVSVPDAGSLDFGNGSFSVGVWVNSGMNPFSSLVSKGGIGAPGWRLAFGQMRITDGTTQVVTATSPALNDGSWHYAMGVIDRGANLMHLYIDGSEVGSAVNIASVGSVTNAAAPLYLGAVTGPSQFYNGSLDEVRVYNRALSAAEVTAAMNDTGLSGGNNPPPDTTPPAITNVQASSVTQNSASISWTTNENSDSQVSYGVTNTYGTVSGLNSNMVTSHTVNLSGLSAATLYHFIAQSRDASGNPAVSPDQSFTTTAAPAGDNQAPAVPTNLSATAVSSSVINLAWTASTDNVGVTGYKVFRNGSQVATPSTNNYSDAGLTASTNYSYTVAAFDAAGNVSGQSTAANAMTQAGSQPSSNIIWTKPANVSGVPNNNGWFTLPYDPVSGQTFVYAAAGSGIYSTDFYFYNSGSNVWTHWGGTGDLIDACPANTPTLPGDRHPLGNMTVDTKRNILWMSGGVCSGNIPADMYYLQLNANPINDTWHQITTNNRGNTPDFSSMVYDSDDDVIFSFGYDIGSDTNDNYVYCSTIGNPSAGTLTAKQSAAGCTMPDGWTEVDAGGAHPPSSWPGLVYDTLTKKVIAFGGGANQTWTYDVPSKTWTRKALATAVPPVGSYSWNMVALAYDSATNKVIYHQTGGAGAPADWQYDPVADTWSQLSASGLGASGVQQDLAYDPVHNTLIGFGGGVWIGQLTGAGVPPQNPPADTTAPTVPANLTVAAVSSSAINLSWTVSTDNVGVTGYNIYRGGVKIGTTANNNYNDNNLTASTNYSYTVAAFDAANNVSAQSVTANATTQANTPPPVVAGNTITVTNTGASATNYPVQIGRPFVQGEIPNGQLPQAVIASTAIPTQVDVKERWPDGSLKYALISFLVPTLNANQSVTVGFAAGATVGNVALTAAQMLDPAFNFDAQIQLTNGGVTKTSSARTMLSNGDYTVWASGPIATTIILANDKQTITCGGKAASTYDFGFDAYCPFRPRYEATFWPTTHQVYIRFVGEIADTEQLEDVVVNNLVLTLGQNNPTTVYTLPAAKAPLTITGGSRWTKEFWLGGTPPIAAINHNLAYVEQTNLIPNFDSTKTVSENNLACLYSTCWFGYTSTKHDLYDFGLWTQAMATAGGRYEIGPLPTWSVFWLYTGDKRAQEMAYTMADLAAAWPMHLREGDSTMKLDYAQTVPGVGKVLSVAAHPTLELYANNLAEGLTSGDYTSATPLANRIVAVGPLTTNNWTMDGAHQPDAFTPQYILSGDYFYLEEMQFWLHFSAARYNPGVGYHGWGRGPTGKEGGISDEVRGNAWVFRNRAETAALSPDGTPEKSYFTQLTNDAIADWEGWYGVTGTQFQNTPEWTWSNAGNAIQGSNNAWAPSFGPPPLGAMENNTGNCNDGTIDLTKVAGCTDDWMTDWVIYALGRGKELGFATDAVLGKVGKFIIGQITDPGSNPYFSAAYHIPVSKSDNTYFSSWADAEAAYVPSYNAQANFNSSIASVVGDAEQPYTDTLIPAMAMTTNEPNGAAAWSWVAQNVLSTPTIATDPKWAIVPRTAVAYTPPPSSSTPTINSFSATPASITTGQSSTLSFNVSNATSLSIDQGVGSVTNLSSKVVSPLVTTTYTLTATNAQGTVTSQATVTVTGPTLPSISNLVSSNTTASSTTISWSTNVLTNGQISYGLSASYGSQSALVDNVVKTLNHTITLSSLTPSTLYHFKATSLDVSNNSANTVDITFTTLNLPPPPAPVISSLTSNPSSLTVGQSAILSWTTSNTTALSLDNSIGTVTGLTSKSISPQVTTTYTLTATGAGGTATKSVTITVSLVNNPPPVSTSTAPTITSFSVSPSSIIAGQTASLSFTVTGSPAPILTLDNSLGAVTGLSSKATSPQVTTTYTLTVTNSAGTASAQVTINVTPAPTAPAPSSGGGAGGSGGGGSGGGGLSSPTNPGPVTPTVNPDGSITFIPKAVTPSPQPATPQSLNPSSALRLVNLSGTYYLIENGQRHGITNPGMLNSYGFSLKDAKPATAADIALPEGSLLLPGNGSLVKSLQDPTVYLISNGQRYGFTKASVFTGLGFKFSSVLVVTNPELQALPKASNLDNPASSHFPGLDILRNKTIYWVGTDNQLHGYPSLAVYNSWHITNDFTRVVPANSADNQLPVGIVVSQRVVE